MTAGGRSRSASAAARRRVPSARLRRTRSLCAGVQRRAATPSPARCTTASTPVSAALSMYMALTSHETSGGDAVPRTARRTLWPPSRSACTSAVPISPCDPVTTTFTGSPYAWPFWWTICRGNHGKSSTRTRGGELPGALDAFLGPVEGGGAVGLLCAVGVRARACCDDPEARSPRLLGVPRLLGGHVLRRVQRHGDRGADRKSTRLNSSH